jgi:hypothetical protein
MSSGLARHEQPLTATFFSLIERRFVMVTVDARAQETAGCTVSASVGVNATKRRSAGQRRLEITGPARVERSGRPRITATLEASSLSHEDLGPTDLGARADPKTCS